MASAMDVDEEEVELPTSSSGKGEKKRFEVKKVSKYNLNSFWIIMTCLIFTVECSCIVGLGYVNKQHITIYHKSEIFCRYCG